MPMPPHDKAEAPWLDNAVIEQLILRVSERLRRGEDPPYRPAPDAKTSFPKILCLDFNKWVDLARAHYDVKGGAEFRPALNAVRHAVDRGYLLVPIAGANAQEVMAPNDEGRRRRTAKFMVELSRNHSLVADTEVVIPEMRAACLRATGKSAPPILIRTRLVQWGMSAAIAGRVPLIRTGEAAMDRLLAQTMHEPEVSVEALVRTQSRERAADFREEDAETTRIVSEIRKVDATLAFEERQRRELANLLRDGALAAQLREVVAALGLNGDGFFERLFADDNWVRFASDVPGIDVMSTLMLHRDRNLDHATHVNDWRDLAFMRVAIPYANFIVAERSWGQIARSCGIAKKYGTQVIADAKELPALLEREGCLPGAD
jgi:hypothetical protein